MHPPDSTMSGGAKPECSCSCVGLLNPSNAGVLLGGIRVAYKNFPGASLLFGSSVSNSCGCGAQKGNAKPWTCTGGTGVNLSEECVRACVCIVCTRELKDGERIVCITGIQRHFPT